MNNQAPDRSDAPADGGQTGLRRQVLFGNYAVAFVDVLSQKDKLRQISALPRNEEQRERFIRLLRETFGVIAEYRRLFGEFFNAPPAPAPPLGAARDEVFGRLMRCEVKKQLFSDSMIYYVPLMDTPDRHSIASVHAMLSACAATFFLGLSQRMVCRIGVDVGIASEYFTGEIYGPALYRAYHLESERAQFPRIAIGDELCKYLASEMSWPGGSVGEQHKRLWARECADWVMTDHDDLQVLDYAGEVTKRLFPRLRDAVEPALKFAFDERNKFEGQGDRKLAERYSKLHDYLAGRKELVWK